MISILIIAAIAISIALGYKTKINTGLFAISFAYILGSFLLGLKPKDIISKWPISIFFVIFSVSLFYNFALVNGTLEKLAMHLLYYFRKIPKFLPFVIFMTAALIAALGAGYFTVMAFLAPITLMLCDKIGMNKLVGAVAVNCGALTGANFMLSPSGIIFRGLIDAAGYNDASFLYATSIFITSLIFSIILISGFLFISKSGKSLGNLADMQKPDKFNQKQKINLYLIVLMVAILLILPILHSLFPDNAIITMLNSHMDIGLLAIVMSVIALLLKLADEKQVITKIPWNTLIMICGVGILIAVAIEAGTIDLLSSWIGTNMAPLLVPVVISFVAAIMSFFSSTLGVVCPALFPLVPYLSAATGINPMILFTCIVIGSQSSAISPFSSGGSLILGSCPTDKERDEMFPKLLFVAVPCSVILSIIVSFIVSLIL
jgi:di/tricarboxylate transporter